MRELRRGGRRKTHAIQFSQISNDDNADTATPSSPMTLNTSSQTQEISSMNTFKHLNSLVLILRGAQKRQEYDKAGMHFLTRPVRSVTSLLRRYDVSSLHTLNLSVIRAMGAIQVDKELVTSVWTRQVVVEEFEDRVYRAKHDVAYIAHSSYRSCWHWFVGFEVAQLDRYLGRICFSKENAAIQTNLLTRNLHKTMLKIVVGQR